MNEVRSNPGGTRSAASAMRDGTVLMECVLVLPLLLALILVIAQFSILWNSLVMTNYAAFNAARAALVYHPGEYRSINEDGTPGKFYSSSGPCWYAAVGTFRTAGMVEGDVTKYVRITPTECDEPTYVGEKSPVVKVTVECDCLLGVPWFGGFLASIGVIDSKVHPDGGLHYMTVKATSVVAKPYLTARYAFSSAGIQKEAEP